MNEQAVSIANSLIEHRNLAMRLYGDNYASRVAPFKALLNEIITTQPSTPPAEHCLRVLKHTESNGSEADMLCMIAAAYEVLGGNS